VLKILLDVDGVVADTRNAIIEKLQLKDPNPKSWDLVKILPPDDKERVLELMDDMDFWSNLPLVDGAKKGVRLLKAYGHEVVWVTSPWKTCIGWESARRFFINEHFGDDTIVVTSEKHHVAGDVFIDDKVDNVESYKKENPNTMVYIFDQPYNQEFHGVPRFDWSKVEKLL